MLLQILHTVLPILCIFRTFFDVALWVSNSPADQYVVKICAHLHCFYLFCIINVCNILHIVLWKMKCSRCFCCCCWGTCLMSVMEYEYWYVLCFAACHPGCLGSCSGPDSTHCASCREGYEHSEEQGCVGKFLTYFNLIRSVQALCIALCITRMHDYFVVVKVAGLVSVIFIFLPFICYYFTVVWWWKLIDTPDKYNI